jgi:hypothetical protein
MIMTVRLMPQRTDDIGILNTTAQFTLRSPNLQRRNKGNKQVVAKARNKHILGTTLDLLVVYLLVGIPSSQNLSTGSLFVTSLS